MVAKDRSRIRRLIGFWPKPPTCPCGAAWWKRATMSARDENAAHAAARGEPRRDCCPRARSHSSSRAMPRGVPRRGRGSVHSRDAASGARPLPHARSHSFSRAPATDVTRVPVSRCWRSRGACRSAWGEKRGAAFARDCPRPIPRRAAANDVTRFGWQMSIRDDTRLGAGRACSGRRDRCHFQAP